MIALEVTTDDQLACVSGVGENGVLTTSVSWVGSDGDGFLSLDVTGLDSRTDEHLGWAAPVIEVGSTVVIRVVEATEVDEPKSRARHDLGSNPAQYRSKLLQLGAKLTADERKQLLRELIAELEAMG